MGNNTADKLMTPAPKKKGGFLSFFGKKDTAAAQTTQADNTDNKALQVTDTEWETHLIQIYGSESISLFHPHVEPGIAAKEYSLNPAIIPLQEGIAMSPGWDFGQISSYEEGKDTKGVIFNATGGALAFEPSNLKGVEATAQLAVATIVAKETNVAAAGADPAQRPKTIQTGETEISASLAEPIVIEPMKDFKMELNNGRIRKGADEAEPKLTFYRTTLTYKDQPVAKDFTTESDQNGLHLVKGTASVPLAEEVLKGNGFEDAQEENKILPQLYMDKEGGARVGHTHKEENVKIGGVLFALHDVKKDGRKILSIGWGKVSKTCDMILQDIQLSDDQKKLSARVESASMQANKSGNIKIEFDRITCDETRGMCTEKATLTLDNKVYTMEQVTMGEAGLLLAETVRSEISGRQTTMHNAVVRTSGQITYKSAEVETVLHFGRNREKSKTAADAQKFFTFRLGEGSVMNDWFENGTEALELASQQSHTEQSVKIQKEEEKPNEKKKKKTAKEQRIELGDVRKSVKVDGDIFTDDGFVQVEDAEFDFKNAGQKTASLQGTGGFKLLKIPYSIVVSKDKNGKPVKLTGTTQEKDPENLMNFTISPEGKISAKFKDDVKLPMLKGENESESIIRTLTLQGVTIEDSVLKAKKVRIDRGLGLEQSAEDHTESETAKTLFGMGLKATLANTAAENEGVQFDPEKGVTGDATKKQLGQFEVSGFLGYLDVSGDYAAGKLHAGLKKEAEKEKDHTKIFGDNKYLTDAGIHIPIAGPLSFELALTSDVKLGGELSADLERKDGKSFSEEMTDAAALKGTLKLSGSTSVGISTGLAVGISALITNLASVDFKLEAGLSAGIDAQLEASTALKKEGKKLKQTEDLTLKGGLKTTLEGALNLKSDVKFLIWKANIFTLELAKKTIKLELEGTATRAKGVKGLKNGWNFKGMELSAQAFGKKAFKSLKENQVEKKEPLEVTQAKKEAIGKDALEAWTILEDLKTKRDLKNRAYFMSDQEKEALEYRIEEITKTARAKLEAYLDVLKQYELQMGKRTHETNQALTDARNVQSKYQEADEVRVETLTHTQAGGFDLKNYQMLQQKDPSQLDPNDKKYKDKLKKLEEYNKGARQQNQNVLKMASIDFAIARILGIYDNAMTRTKDEYDVYAQVENMKRAAKNKAAKAKDINAQQQELLKLSSELSEYEFLNNRQGLLGPQREELRYKTLFSHTAQKAGVNAYGDDVYRYSNYFDVLYDDALDRGREGYGKNYKEVFRRSKMPKGFGPSKEKGIYGMSGYDFLKCVLTDRFPENACDKDGKDCSGGLIGGTPEEKLKALEHLFGNTRLRRTFVEVLEKAPKKLTEREEMLKDTNTVYGILFDSNVEEMTHKGNVNIAEKLKELDENLAAAKQNYLKAVQDNLDAQETVQKARAEREDCENKLKKLTEGVAQGVALQGQAVAGATDAVDFMEKDYQDIASGNAIMKSISGNEKVTEMVKNNQNLIDSFTKINLNHYK